MEVPALQATRVNPVDRKRVLRQVDTLTKTLSNLNEARTTIRDARHPRDPERIQLNDPDSYRLLVAQKNLNDMLGRFCTKDEARAAMEAMNNYVGAIQQRRGIGAICLDFQWFSQMLRA